MTLTVLKLAYVYKLVTQILMYVEAMAHTISLLTQQTPHLTRPCVGATASQDHTVVYASMVMGQHCSQKVYHVLAVPKESICGF